MSTTEEIAKVHEAESKFRLKPHRVVNITGPSNRLTATLEEIMGPQLIEQLRKLELIP